MLTYWDIEYTDPDSGKPKKVRTLAVNGLHTEDAIREHIVKHKQFGDAPITKLTKVTDSAELAAAAASRPGDMPAEVVKNIQAAETAANTPTQSAASAFPPAPNAPQAAPAQA